MTLSGKQKSVLIVIFLIPFLVADVIKYISLPPDLARENTIRIRIPRGATVAQIADTLLASNLIQNTDLFTIWTATLGAETKLKAGLFEVPRELNYPQLVEYLTRPQVNALYVTLIEGWPTGRINQVLARELELDRDTLDSLAADSSFARQLGIKAGRLDGYLLPDTYAFTLGISETEILKFLVDKTFKLFRPDSVQSAMKKLGMDMHEILTLASIVEGEAILDDERPTIASVYHNRLKRGMKLQADPTIQYVLPGGPRRLLLKDLEIDSPYNTYVNYGLPPGPINNPGKASIQATIFPEDTGYLYFVAKGDGSHTFSRNAAEHARAKAAFNKVRRKVMQERRNQKKRNE